MAVIKNSDSASLISSNPFQCETHLKCEVKRQALTVYQFMKVSVEGIYGSYGDSIIAELFQVQKILRSFNNPYQCKYESMTEMMGTNFGFSGVTVQMMRVRIYNGHIRIDIKSMQRTSNKNPIVIASVIIIVAVCALCGRQVAAVCERKVVANYGSRIVAVCERQVVAVWNLLPTIQKFICSSLSSMILRKSGHIIRELVSV